MSCERILYEDVTPIAQSSGQSMVGTNMDENYFYRSKHDKVGANFSQFIGLYFQWLFFPRFFWFYIMPFSPNNFIENDCPEPPATERALWQFLQSPTHPSRELLALT